VNETLRAAIRDIYQQVHAPDWAAANLDALVDVLRDASWLPIGPIDVSVPTDVHGADRRRLRAVLAQAVAETADGPRPVRVRPASGSASGSDEPDVDGGAH
jgi:hypothetical protein